MAPEIWKLMKIRFRPILIKLHILKIPEFKSGEPPSVQKANWENLH